MTLEGKSYAERCAIARARYFERQVRDLEAELRIARSQALQAPRKDGSSLKKDTP